jgi:hypothetical protein
VRRIGLLPQALLGAGVAGPCLDAQIEPHLADRRHEIALDIRRQRLQGRDIERMQAGRRVAGKVDQAGQEAG